VVAAARSNVRTIARCLIIITALITMARPSGVGRKACRPAPPLASGTMHRVHARPATNAGDPPGVPPRGRTSLQETHMLKWAIIFAIISLVTGWLGFGGLAGVTATIAKVLFVCFVILFLLAVLAVMGVISLF
jgi:uncharacterized membrane protein YtjA (UPF0391 family)